MSHGWKEVFVGTALGAAAAIACTFSPTSPFEGFDGQGSRVSGTIENESSEPLEGMTVSLRDDASMSANVLSDGTFTLKGIPDGTVVLVFKIHGRVVGEITLRDVVRNQEIRLHLKLTIRLRIEIVIEIRDRVDFMVKCARSAGFWCSNQDGHHPNLTAEQFEKLAQKAAKLLESVPALDTREEVAASVCDTHDQLLRQLAALALNIAAGLDEDTRLRNESFATIGEAFKRAIEIAAGNASDRERRDMAVVLERINNNRNTEIPGCREDDDDSDDDTSDDSDDDTPNGATCSGVEIPRGQFPPPGACKIWDPRLPAGQQGPPGNCDDLCARKPSGTCVIDHNGNVVC